MTFVRWYTSLVGLGYLRGHKLRSKGNPNWGKSCGDIPNTPTSFEERVRRLKLSEKEYLNSIPLKEWAKKHKDSKLFPKICWKRGESRRMSETRFSARSCYATTCAWFPEQRLWRLLPKKCLVKLID